MVVVVVVVLTVVFLLEILKKKNKKNVRGHESCNKKTIEKGAGLSWERGWKRIRQLFNFVHFLLPVCFSTSAINLSFSLWEQFVLLSLSIFPANSRIKFVQTGGDADSDISSMKGCSSLVMTLSPSAVAPAVTVAPAMLASFFFGGWIDFF